MLITTSVTLEADAVKYLEAHARAKDNVFFKVLVATSTEASTSKDPIIDIFVRKFQQIATPQGKKLLDYYDIVDTRTDDKAAIEYLRTEIQEATARSVAIIRERIIQSGYGEPTIRELTPYRMTIEVQSVEKDSFKKILADGRLEFRLRKDAKTVYHTLDRIDKYLTGTPEDTTRSTDYSGLTEEERVAKFENEHPLSAILYRNATSDGRSVFAFEKDSQVIVDIVNMPEVRHLYEDEMSINFSRPVSYSTEVPVMYEVYFLEPTPELTGGFVVDAKGDTRFGGYYVYFTMDDEGTRIWSRITDKNINKQIAIMVDNVVYAAPTIRSRIEGGVCEIAGIKDSQEAELLAILLKTGGLPVSMKIVGE